MAKRPTRYDGVTQSTLKALKEAGFVVDDVTGDPQNGYTIKLDRGYEVSFDKDRWSIILRGWKNGDIHGKKVKIGAVDNTQELIDLILGDEEKAAVTSEALAARLVSAGVKIEGGLIRKSGVAAAIKILVAGLTVLEKSDDHIRVQMDELVVEIIGDETEDLEFSVSTYDVDQEERPKVKNYPMMAYSEIKKTVQKDWGIILPDTLDELRNLDKAALASVVVANSYKDKIEKFISHPWQEDAEIDFIQLISDTWADNYKDSDAAWKRYMRDLIKENSKQLTMRASDAFMQELDKL